MVYLKLSGQKKLIKNKYKGKKKLVKNNKKCYFKKEQRTLIQVN